MNDLVREDQILKVLRKLLSRLPFYLIYDKAFWEKKKKYPKLIKILCCLIWAASNWLCSSHLPDFTWYISSVLLEYLQILGVLKGPGGLVLSSKYTELPGSLWVTLHQPLAWPEQTGPTSSTVPCVGWFHVVCVVVFKRECFKWGETGRKERVLWKTEGQE